MRKVDEGKSTGYGKAQKTINFDKLVLIALEKRARNTGSSVSNLVNDLVRRVVLSDADFYEERARFHAMKVAEFQYMVKRALDMQEIIR